MKHSLCSLYIFWILYSICCYCLVPEQIQAHTGLGKDWIGQEDRSYRGQVISWVPVGRWEEGCWGFGVRYRGLRLCGLELMAHVGLCPDSGHDGVPCLAGRHCGYRFLVTRETSSRLVTRAQPFPSLTELRKCPANWCELDSDCWALSDDDIQSMRGGDRVGVS